MIKILIVEDRNSISDVIKDILVSKDFKVVGQAGTGREAIDLYEEHEPDLVLMDLLLPDMSGIEATREIVGKHPDARVIAVTALSREGVMEDCIKAGCRSFLVKPFRVKDLIDIVDEVLRG